jgi:hypothetical protein
MPLPVLRQKDFVHRLRFQLWTDALCFREMANQAPNNYLRGMSVRNAVLSAWTTLETACYHALGVRKLRGRDFQNGLNKALTTAGKKPVNFRSKIWRPISKIRKRRNAYMLGGGKTS